MPCIDETTIWSAQLTLTHIAPLTSLFVGWLGSYRRGVGLNQRIRLRELVHMAKQRAGGALATWPRRGAHLLRPRLPAASAASSRATTSAHRTPVLAVLLPAHCTANSASLADRAEVVGGRDGGFVAHGAPKKTAASWNPRPEDPSGVSRDQAGRPSKARGIGLVETAEHVAWTRAPSAGGSDMFSFLHVSRGEGSDRLSNSTFE